MPSEPSRAAITKLAAWLGLALVPAAGACDLAPLRRSDLVAASPDDGGAPPLDAACRKFEPPVGLECASSQLHDKDPCTLVDGGPEQNGCWRRCGPIQSGIENCQCTTYSSGAPSSASPVARWICRGCTYDSENPYSDFALLPPALLPACGPPGQGGGPPTPVMAGTMCPATQRGPCGSSTADAYLDGKGAKKKGYCVCDPNASKWSCATVDDWPPACLTDRP